MIDERLPRSSAALTALTALTVAAFAGPGHAALIRANAALAVAKAATLAALDLNGGTLSPADRGGLATALRDLGGGAA